MKITLVTQFLEGHGGTERVISELINHDLANCYQVLVTSSGEKPEWLQWITRKEGYEVKICHKPGEAIVKEFIKSNILNCRPDIVIALEGRANRVADKLRKDHGLDYKIISWSHTSIKEGGFFVPEDLKHADYHLAISSGIQRQLIADGVSADKIFLVYNPVIIQHSDPIKAPAAGKPFHPIFIGRMIFEEQKNVHMLLDSLKNFPQPWQLDMYGKGYDMDKIKGYAKKLGIAENINMHGWVPDPWKDIDEADCLLLASNYEGFPMVLVEALSRGLPVISTDCPTGPEDIVNSKNGILTPVNDPQAFANACLDLYQDRATFDRNEVQHSIDKFSVSHYIDHLEKIYKIVEPVPSDS